MAEKHFTGLRAKMLVVVAAGMVLLFTILFIAARTVLFDGYARLETSKTLTQVKGAVGLLNDQIGQLDRLVVDNAHWDDAYRYMVERDPGFIESSFNSETFSNIKVNAIIFADSDGKVIFKRGVDFISGKPWPIPASLEQAFTEGGVLVSPLKKQTSGLFWTPEGICIVSESPRILRRL